MRPHINDLRRRPTTSATRRGLATRVPEGCEIAILPAVSGGLMLREAPVATPPGWTAAVLADFDAFLLDHAANERKASSAALALVAHYPDRPELVERCIALAIEELSISRRSTPASRHAGLALGPGHAERLSAAARARVPRGQRAVLPGPPADRRHRRGARLRALRPPRGGAARGAAEGLLPRDRARRGPAPGALHRPGARSTSRRRRSTARLEELLEAEAARIGARCPSAPRSTEGPCYRSRA